MGGGAQALSRALDQEAIGSPGTAVTERWSGTGPDSGSLSRKNKANQGLFLLEN